MADIFHLIDLVSQAAAVQRLLGGRSSQEKLDWLADHGAVHAVASTLRNVQQDNFPQVNVFESAAGLRCGFFIVGDKFVFIGDNTTFTVKDDSP